MKTAGKIVIAAVVIGGIALGVTAVAKASGGGGGGGGGGGSKPPTGNDIDPTFDPFDTGKDTPGGGGGGGGSGGVGTPKLRPGGFRTFGGDPNGGMIFGHISDASAQNNAQWNPNGNTVRFSSDCSVVLVGRQVWMMNETIDTGEWGTTHYSNCVEYSNVKACWRHGQNLCCRIDSLMNTDGLTSAAAIGERVLREMEPPCIDAPFSSWPPAMQNFVQWLRAHINEYVRDSGGQADW